MSSWPAVQTNPTRAPARWIMVLVATVVPCTRKAMSSGATSDASMEPRKARSGSAGVDATLRELTVPSDVSKAIRSVKVPPVSIPMRAEVMSPCRSCCG